MNYGGANYRKRQKGRIGAIEKPKSCEDHGDQAGNSQTSGHDIQRLVLGASGLSAYELYHGSSIAFAA